MYTVRDNADQEIRMQTRTRTEYRVDPLDDGQLPRLFLIVRNQTTETRRHDRERWSYNASGPREITEMGPLTRDQLAKLIADAADMLAYPGGAG
jgi:hypothetical protein